MKAVYLFLVIMLMLTGSVSANDYSKAESLVIDSSVIIAVAVKKTSGSLSFDYITVNYSWLPVEDYRQEVISISSVPASENKDGTMVFDLSAPENFDLIINFRTKTTSNPVKVRTKVDFPIRRMESDLIEYTKPSKLIDINDDIRSVASSLARGEDDLFVVVFKIGDWVNTNIEYNLSTLTAEASLPSSWVLREKQGVCDELSNLFVSMLRSLGIPARTVTGISYTDSELFDFNWGAHGWTEVYFPGYGWIPFDPTYNQLGYVDATHIKLGNKKDDERFNTEFEWKGKGFTVEPLGQTVESEVITSILKQESEVDIEISYMRESVGFGSYNVVVAELENKENYYVTRVIDISRVQGIEILDEARRDILLKPKEKKKVYWIVKVASDLNERYVYTFPFIAYSNFEEISNDGFRSSRTAEQITLNAAQSFSTNGDKLLTLSQMQCRPVIESIYMNEEAEIICALNNKEIQQLRICIEGNCETKNSVNGEFSKNIRLSEPGIRTFLVEANTVGFKEESFVTIEVIDATSILIRNMEVTEKIRFEETASIEFMTIRDSSSVPMDVNVKITHDLFEKEWKMRLLEQTQGYRFYVKGEDLKSKNNIIKIEITYHDSKGRRYVTETSTEIELIELKFFQRIRIWFNDVESWLT